MESFCFAILPEPVSTWNTGEVKPWTFLNKESESVLPPPSQNGWLITSGAVQHVWRKVSEEPIIFLETRNLNQGDLENTFGTIRLHCGSNNNPSLGQFVDALKTTLMVLLTEACMALTLMMMVPLFWTSYTYFSSHPMLHQSVHQKVMTMRPLTVFHTLFILEKKYNVE
jgi:hypothetical protein